MLHAIVDARVQAEGEPVAGRVDRVGDCIDLVGTKARNVQHRAENFLGERFDAVHLQVYDVLFFEQILDAGIRMRVLHYVPNATAQERCASAARLASLAEAVRAGDAAASDRAIERMIMADAAIVVRSLEPRFGAEMRVERFGAGLSAP